MKNILSWYKSVGIENILLTDDSEDASFKDSKSFCEISSFKMDSSSNLSFAAHEKISNIHSQMNDDYENHKIAVNEVPQFANHNFLEYQNNNSRVLNQNLEDEKIVQLRSEKSTLHDEISKINSLHDLKELLLRQDCELKKTATNLVFGCGNEKSKIVFVGEAPGKDEDEQGIPFVGQSGQLLNNIFLAAGLKRDEIYITNVVPWRPDGNRTPSTDEIAFFTPFLMKHLELINPKIVVCLGATATKSVLQTKSGILSMRGMWKNFKFPNGDACLLMPTYHPSYLLRSSSNKKIVWKDFINIRHKMKDLNF